MEYLEVKTKSTYGIGSKLLYYYNILGDKTFRENIAGVDSFSDIMDFIYSYNNQKPVFTSMEPLLETTISMPKNNKAIVSYSAGVDSTYKALALREAGHDVTLVHASKINRAYPDETVKALAFSKEFDFNLVMVETKKNGTEARPDNPIKDELILGYALDYGLDHDINHYCTGNYHHYFADDVVMEDGMSTSIEIFKMFSDGVRKYIPNFEYSQIDVSKLEVFRLVLKTSPKIMQEHVTSCITPYRFKNKLCKINTSKYHIDLIPNHCGTCYKCAQEYLLLRELGFYPDNKEYVARCCDIFRKDPSKMIEVPFSVDDSNDTIIEKVIKYL